MIFNHISLRVPGPDRHFLINPFGLWYREVTASNSGKIDVEGNPVDSNQWPSTALDSSFTPPSMRRARIRIASCIHTPPRAWQLPANAMGLPGQLLPALIRDQIAYHDFEGVTVRDDEKPRLVARLATRTS